MKDISFCSDKPLFQRLFEDPTATSLGDPKLIKQLNHYVNENPDYKIPPGFVKFRAKQLVDKYETKKTIETGQICEEILDELFVERFGIHMFNPQATMVERWVVKPDVF